MVTIGHHESVYGILQVRYWTFSTFGWNPLYNLIWISDITSFAMNTVGEVNLKFLFALVCCIINDVVHLCRTESLTRVSYSSVHLVTRWSEQIKFFGLNTEWHG